MTKTHLPTLRDLFLSDRSDSPGPRNQDLPAVPASITALFGPYEWQGLCDRVPDLLEVGVADILIAGWRESVEFRKQVQASERQPHLAVLVHLDAHTITSAHRPTIRIFHEGQEFGEVTVPVAVEFEVDGVQLTLKGGAVREVRAGNVRMRGTVMVEDRVILERSLSPVPLPARILLDAPSAR